MVAEEAALLKEAELRGHEVCLTFNFPVFPSNSQNVRITIVHEIGVPTRHWDPSLPHAFSRLLHRSLGDQ